jgi:hypothetical protein
VVRPVRRRAAVEGRARSRRSKPAWREQLAEIDRIANDPAAPTFDNTIAALERSGRTLDRVSTVYGIYTSTLKRRCRAGVEREMAPKLAAFSDRITQNEKLFARIAGRLRDARARGSDAEQQRLTWLYYTNFVRAGAKLDAPAKQRLSEINQRARRAVHAVQPERAEGRERAGAAPRVARPTSPACRIPSVPTRGRRRRRARPQGQVGDR